MLIKRIILFILILTLVCISSMTVVYAGDPGEHYDSDRLVSFSVKPYRYNADIGGENKFKLTINNNSDYECYIDSLSRIYHGYKTPYIDIDIDIDDAIAPHKSIEIDLSTEIVKTADFYMDEESFYLDYDIRLNYASTIYCDGMYPRFYSFQTNKARLLINNLKDGSELVGLSYADTTTETHLRKDWSRYYRYTTNVKNDIHVDLVADNSINNVLIINNNNAESIAVLTSKEKVDIKEFINYNYFRKLSRVSNIDTFTTRAIWNNDGEYFITILEQSYPVKRLLFPEISIVEEKDSDNYTVKVYNESSMDINNLYLNFNYNQINYAASGNNIYVIPLIEKDGHIKLKVKESIIKIKKPFVIGLKYDDYAALWCMSFRKSSFSREIYSYPGRYIGYIDLSPKIKSTPLPTATSTTTPTREIVTPTQELVNTNTTSTEADTNEFIYIIIGIIIVLHCKMKLN